MKRSSGGRQISFSREGAGGRPGGEPGGEAGRGERRRRSRRGDNYYSSRRDSSLTSRSRQDSTRELVDFFAYRMQEARDAWSGRVTALQKRWQTAFYRGDWGLRGGSASADRDAALRLTFGLIVRMYAYEDAWDDLRLAAEQDPSVLEAFAPQVCIPGTW